MIIFSNKVTIHDKSSIIGPHFIIQKVWVFTMVCASCTNTKNSTVPDNFVLKEDVYTIKRLTLPKEFCLFVNSGVNYVLTIRVTWWVSCKRQELLIPREHLVSPSVFGGARVDHCSLKALSLSFVQVSRRSGCGDTNNQYHQHTKFAITHGFQCTYNCFETREITK
jgi:hypothetical protein